MKKLSLILAFILVFTSLALCACDSKKVSDSDSDSEPTEGASTAKKAAEAAFDALYVDFDADAFFKVSVECNLEIAKKCEDGHDYRDDAKDNRSEVKDGIKNLREELGEKNGKMKCKIESCETYKKDSEEFESYMNNFPFRSETALTIVKEIAVVEIEGVFTYVDEDGEEIEHENYMTFYCFKIDGRWYVSIGL